jgi:diguanylate cyclase (GGDEF)-like protein/PAS domain S-box-containing protein
MTDGQSKPLPTLNDTFELHTRTAVVVTEGAVGQLKIRRANPAFAAMVGIPRDELLGRPLLDLTGPETDVGTLRAAQGDLVAGRAVLSEIAIHRADGSPLWIEADFAPLGDSGHFLVIARDITERRARQAELARAHELLGLATAAGGVGIWEWEPDADVAHWNPTLYDLAGVPQDETIGLDMWLEMTHPDDREIARAAAEARWGAGESRHRVIRPSDGRVIHVVVRAASIGSGADVHIVGTVVDVTELQQASERVRATLESITDAHYAVDRDWCFTYVNRRAEELLGREREELLGRNLWDEFPGARASTFEDQYREAMTRGEPVAFEAYYEPLEEWYEVRAYPVPDGIAVYFRDIGDRRSAEIERERLLAREQQARQVAEAAQVELQHQAAHDALTNLANRTQLLEHLDTALAAGTPVSVLFVDLDRFKLVNDSLGHAVGDALLQTVAERLTTLVRRHDIVARIGGDEFVVGLVDSEPADVDAVAARVLEAVQAPVKINGHSLVASASIGISAADGAAADAETLLRDADVALYRAKDAGRDQAVWFDARARADVLERVRIERDLRAALGDGQLALHYQPAFDLRSGKMFGVEALLRWSHPGRGPIAPGEFIPVAEESGLILPIGDWVLETTVAQSGALGDGGPFTAWANVSARQLARPGLCDAIARLLEKSGLPAERFGIEITESVLGDSTVVRRELTRICELGVSVAIDDFGTGFSSIGRLRDLPVDVLKIDRSFVAGIGSNGGVETVAAIIHLGHALGRTVLAEGVETTEQLEALRAVGCDAVAGFLLARPCVLDEVAAAAERGSELLAATG